jgi:hypothetical protein
MFHPRVLSILAILLLAASGYLCFKNDKAYKAEIEWRVQTQRQLKVSQDRLATAIKNLDDTIKEDNDYKEKITVLLAEEETKTKEKHELDRQFRAKQDQVNYYKNNPDLLREWEDKERRATKCMGEIKILHADITQLNTDISERETKLAGLTANNTDLVTKHTNLREHIESRSGGRSVPGLKAGIRAVYNNWGFVTLNAGDKAGVVFNSTLDVVRDKDVVAKLLVTVVERDTASATIIPDSVTQDTVLMPGDKVVPATAGVGPAVPAAPAAAAAATLAIP